MVEVDSLAVVHAFDLDAAFVVEMHQSDVASLDAADWVFADSTYLDAVNWAELDVVDWQDSVVDRTAAAAVDNIAALVNQPAHLFAKTQSIFSFKKLSQ